LIRNLLTNFVAGLSTVGLVTGVIFFCGSLTPSLLPRHPAAQGVLSGLALAVGYGLGVGAMMLYRFLELRELGTKKSRIVKLVFLVAGLVAAAATLGRMANWQNSIRSLMEMPEIDSGYPTTVVGVALVSALTLILLVRLLIMLIGQLSRWLQKLMPRRVAVFLSATVIGLIVINLVNGVIIKQTVRLLDEAFAAVDQAIDDDMEPPQSHLASGGPGSLIAWQEIGKNGKRFLLDGPNSDQITQLTGRPALEPIRVYAGYNTGETLQQRAEIALAELIRVGGFDRQVLIVATPTGTGWLDPSAVQPLPFLHDGDLAIVSMQYSYLPSWLTIMVDPSRSWRSAKALFDEVYNHWTNLPKGNRPRLYLYGLSLGSLGSEAALDLFQWLGDPIDGAVLSGPPFPSRVWPMLVRNRRADTPAWLPIFRDSALVRFMNQNGIAAAANAQWGVLRVIYIQHASDPMVFFSPSLAYRPPAWLEGERGPGVSPYFRWFPLVTFLQVGFDVPMATAAPLGHAHNYAPDEYIDAFIEVTEPENWRPKDTEKLKLEFADFNASPL